MNSRLCVMTRIEGSGRSQVLGKGYGALVDCWCGVVCVVVEGEGVFFVSGRVRHRDEWDGSLYDHV